MQLHTHEYFFLQRIGLISQQDRRNIIDLDTQMVSIARENIPRFENGSLVGSLMIKIWKKLVTKDQKVLSPRSLIIRYPPLNPILGNMRELLNNEK